MELADPFAMPLTSPPFAHGPYRCTNGDCLIVTYRTGHPALEEAVLEALTFEERLVHCEFMHTEPSTGFLPLFGSRAALPVKLKGKPGAYTHNMPSRSRATSPPREKGDAI